MVSYIQKFYPDNIDDDDDDDNDDDDDCITCICIFTRVNLTGDWVIQISSPLCNILTNHFDQFVWRRIIDMTLNYMMVSLQ